MDKTCKNCRHWHNKRTCDRIDQINLHGTRDEELGKNDSRIEWSAADDHGLHIELVTGPDFGCVQFEPIKEKP